MGQSLFFKLFLGFFLIVFLLTASIMFFSLRSISGCYLNVLAQSLSKTVGGTGLGLSIVKHIAILYEA